jgi:hypothetical protein
MSHKNDTNSLTSKQPLAKIFLYMALGAAAGKGLWSLIGLDGIGPVLLGGGTVVSQPAGTDESTRQVPDTHAPTR